MKTVTIVGHTTPGSIVITDSSEQDYTSAVRLTPRTPRGTSLSDNEFFGDQSKRSSDLDPFGRQLVRDYPIYWIAYARPGSSLGNTPGL